VPVYDSIISRGDAAGLIPDEVAGDVLKAAVQESAALALSRRVTMTSKLYRSPVLSLLPQAYWLSSDTGLKQTSEAAFQGLDLTAEEIAVLIPIPEAVLDDASYDVWGALRDPIAQAIAVKLDAAIFAGTEKPASWPTAIIPAAIAASNTSQIGATAAEGGIYTDIIEAGDAPEADGYEVQGYVVKRALRSHLRRMRDTTGQLLTDTSADQIAGLPVAYAPAGTMTATEHAIAGQWDLSVIGVRQDLTFKVLDQAVISDDTGAVVLNLAQQDSVALRVVARYGWAVGTPAALAEAVSGTAYPFGVLQGTLPTRAGGTRSTKKAS
jgi:HK97 family phage major capsid protein